MEASNQESFDILVNAGTHFATLSNGALEFFLLILRGNDLCYYMLPL